MAAGRNLNEQPRAPQGQEQTRPDMHAAEGCSNSEVDSASSTSEPEQSARTERRPRRQRRAPEAITTESWIALDTVNLEEEFSNPVKPLQEVPIFLRSGLRQ